MPIGGSGAAPGSQVCFVVSIVSSSLACLFLNSLSTFKIRGLHRKSRFLLTLLKINSPSTFLNNMSQLEMSSGCHYKIGHELQVTRVPTSPPYVTQLVCFTHLRMAPTVPPELMIPGIEARAQVLQCVGTMGCPSLVR